jgi:hypothetical protein
MSFRYVQFVLVPALGWAFLLGTAFVGVGGLGLQGTSDVEIQRLWQVAGTLTVISFVVALAVFAVRARHRDFTGNHL